MKKLKFRWVLAGIGLVLTLLFVEIPAWREGGDMAGYIPLLPTIMATALGYILGIVFDSVQKVDAVDKPKTDVQRVLWFFGTLAALYLIYVYLNFLGMVQFFISICVIVFGLYKIFSRK